MTKEYWQEKIARYKVYFGGDFIVTQPTGFMSPAFENDSDLISELDEKGYLFIGQINGCLHFKKENKKG